jgi:hypothetical protein
MASYLPPLDITRFYRQFDRPVTDFDCGAKCTPYNPHGIPFCCDICKAVPVAYRQEWDFLQKNTDLWHEWRGDECAEDPCDPAELLDDTPDHMLLLACKGPAHCQREFRASSCRQFPFFPYVTYDYRFVGLAYDWDFEPACWVISHLETVTSAYRAEFVSTYDEMFSSWQEELECYAILSEDMRIHFSAHKRRIPLLHRNGGYYLVSPDSERMQRIPVERFKRFGPYKTTENGKTIPYE